MLIDFHQQTGIWKRKNAPTVGRLLASRKSTHLAIFGAKIPRLPAVARDDNCCYGHTAMHAYLGR